MATDQQGKREAAQSFVKTAASEGLSDEIIVRILKSKGWAENQINKLWTDFYEQKIGLSVPGPSYSKGESAKDSFLYLLSFSTLGTWIWALGSILFTVLNQSLPDSLANNSYYTSSGYSYAGPLASAIVAFPIYLWMMWLINKDVKSDPDKLESRPRKWLTYVTLFIAAGCMIGDLITLLTYFLLGDVTLRFVLKVLVVLILAGGVFGYYLSSVQKKSSQQ